MMSKRLYSVLLIKELWPLSALCGGDSLHSLRELLKSSYLTEKTKIFDRKKIELTVYFN